MRAVVIRAMRMDRLPFYWRYGRALAHRISYSVRIARSCDPDLCREERKKREGGRGRERGREEREEDRKGNDRGREMDRHRRWG